MPDCQIQIYTPNSLPSARDLHQLASILHASVSAGASVGFILPFTIEEASVWWQTVVFPKLESGARLLLVARDGDTILGTVQLILDTPPNQAHRADVAKLQVHPSARRRGIARQLMLAVEAEAIRRNRSLLTLDTITGGEAEPLYLSLGYQLSGTIPNYARAPLTPVLESTSVFYKQLSR